jgi:sucrose-6-phosphate hydrolase SacC (GH32 family)
LPLEPDGRLFHLQAEVNIPEGSKLVFNVRGIPVTLTSTTLEAGGRPARTMEPVSTIELLVDRTSIETFVNRGEVSLTRFVIPKEDGLSAKAEGGPIVLRSLTVFPLKPAWSDTSKE